MKQNPNVPAFLTKLWTLVENSDTNELICWSQEGNSFLVLDEQRFAKEILPKFFKHNNMASFVRQLNMYGFRKVMHVDTGVVKQERDGPVEFQHPYFKHGKDDLLEHIKRKVSSARPEDSKIRHEDLSKILSSMQNVHDKQESIDSRLAALKRENEALWTEMSDLRQKHAQQQHVIKELVQFILSLLNMKRKRPLLLNSNSKKAKFIHQLYEEPADHSKAAGLSGVKNSVDVSEDVIICDVTDQGAEITVDNSRVLDQGDVEILEVDLTDGQSEDVREDVGGLLDISGEQEEAPCIPIAPPTSSALQLNKGFGQEDPVTMMDSILNESGTISQNINLLGKVELMDYLDSIDCSLEDFQALLYGKQFSMSLSPAQQQTENTDLVNRTDRLDSDSADKQLIQYTSCPLLAYLDGCTPLPPGPEEPSAAALADSVLGQVGAEPGAEPGDLLEPDPERPPRSSLIRLEPLTEAEASETTLFYLCELNPELPCADTPPLDL